MLAQHGKNLQPPGLQAVSRTFDFFFNSCFNNRDLLQCSPSLLFYSNFQFVSTLTDMLTKTWRM
jgi:hypothetical protein